MESYSHNIWSQDNVCERLDYHSKQGPCNKEIKYLINTKKLKGRKVYLQDPQITKLYLSQCSHLVLYGSPVQMGDPIKETLKCFATSNPPELSKESPTRCHGDIRHMGLDWMLYLHWEQFYWPGMTKDVELHITRHEWCIWFKSKPQRAKTENIKATYPLKLVHLDYLAIEMTEGGKDAHVLIITDHFMTYAQALVTSSQAAMCTAQALWDWLVVHYGLPESIISDQHQNFERDLISDWCKLAKVWKLHTTPYHPETSRQYEWFNSTLINMLGTLPQNKKSSWRDMVPMLVHAYNCTRSTATGLGPYYLMYGQKPWLPVNLYFGTQKADMNAATSTKFLQQLFERLKWAYRTAQQYHWKGKPDQT